MTTGVACPQPIMQFFTNAGNPAVGGSVLTQVGGVNTAVYSDVNLTTALPNPIPLNSRGEASTAAGASSQVFLTPNTAYTFTLSDANGNTLWVATYVNGVQVNITQAIIAQALYPQSPSEIAASVTPVNFAIPPPEVSGFVVPDRYGVNSTPGTTLMDSPIGSAIAVAKALNGGASVIQFLSATYLCANAIGLASANGITLRGMSNLTGGSGQGTVLKSSLNTTASFINAQGSHGVSVRDMQITNQTSGYTGTLLDFSGTASAGRISNLLLILGSTGQHLYLDAITGFKADWVQFNGGLKSVVGQSSAGGSYSQLVHFDTCNWSGSVDAPVWEGGNGWKFTNCYWEALSAGAAGAFTYTSGNSTNGIAFDTCWFGDQTVAGTWLNLTGSGIVVIACDFEGGGTTSTCIALNTAYGFVIEANQIYNIGTFVNFATATCRGGSVRHNQFNYSVTTPFANITNCDNSVQLNPNYPRVTSTPTYSQSTTGFEITDNGLIEQWGSGSVTDSSGSGTLAVTFGKAYASNVYELSITPQGTCTSWVTSVSTTGFTVNMSGMAANTSFFWRSKGV